MTDAPDGPPAKAWYQRWWVWVLIGLEALGRIRSSPSHQPHPGASLPTTPASSVFGWHMLCCVTMSPVPAACVGRHHLSHPW